MRQIDREKVFKAAGFRPFPEQTYYLDSDARFRIAVCGRRFGKSKMAAMDKLPLLLDPTSQTRGWIVGPQYSLGEKEFRYLWDAIVIKLGLASKLKRKANNVRSGEMYIEMPWGSRVDVKSADHPDGLVGEGLHWIIMSEAAKHPVAIWEKYLRPTLADYHGTADFVTTPEGYNWIYDLYNDALTDDSGAWEGFHFPSWRNPYVYPGGREDPEILALEKTSSRPWFLQEIAAEFVAFAGRIYDEFDPQIHVDEWEYDPRVPNALAVDFGFTNPFVALDVQVTASDEVHIWDEYYVSSEPVHKHAEILRNRQRPPGYSISYGVGDPADPGGIKTLSEGLGTMFFADNELKDWNHGVHEVKKLLNPANPRLFVHKRCVNTIKEFLNYRTKEQSQTSLGVLNADERPAKHADHAMDALRYFVMQRFVFGAGYHLTTDMVRPDSQADDPHGWLDRESKGLFTLDRAF